MDLLPDDSTPIDDGLRILARLIAKRLRAQRKGIRAPVAKDDIEKPERAAGTEEGSYSDGPPIVEQQLTNQTEETE